MLTSARDLQNLAGQLFKNPFPDYKMMQPLQKTVCFLSKLNTELPHDPAIPLLEYKEVETCSNKRSYINVHSGLPYNSQKVEITQMSTNRGMDEQTVVPPCRGRLFIHKKEWHSDMCYTTDER